MNKPLNELTTLNKHPFIKNLRDAAKVGHNSLTNAINVAAVDTYGGKNIAKAKPSWGSFSAVFPHKESTVLKVYHDPAYADFVNYAKANQHDPHMPRIYSHTRTPDGIGLVRMEKLHPYHTYSHQLRIAPYDGENGTETKSYHDMGDHNESLWQARTGASLHMLLHDVPGRAMLKNNPTLHKSLSNLAKAHPSHAMDIHPDNVMKRADGTTVITDPFWDEQHYFARKTIGNILKEMMTFNKHPLTPTLTRPRDSRPYSNQELGKGIYASVYDRGKHNSVIKVYREDTGYEDFLGYAKANQDNPHIPKIYAHKRLPNGGGVVRMEKLQERPTDETVSKKFSNPEGSSHDWLVGKNIKEPLNARMDNMAKNFPSLHKTIYHMEHTSEHEHEWDIGSFHDTKNVMYRDNTPVLSDPWYSRGRPKKPKLDEMMTLNRHPLITSLKNTDMKSFPSNPITNAVHLHYGVSSQANRLGSGVYGSVYKHPKNENTVIKVYSDRGYHEYVNWAKQNQDNPHVPKIYAHKQLNDSGLGVVKMEKLQPLSRENPADNKYIIHGNSYLRGKEGHLIARQHDSNEFDTAMDDKDLAGIPDSYHQTIHKLASAFPDKRFDLHGANLMKRIVDTPDGKRHVHTVITDPFVDPLNEMVTLNRLSINKDDFGTLKDNENTPRGHYHDISQKYKVTALGSGISGAAFPHKNPDKVVKVYSKWDTNYDTLANYAKAHSEDPHFPKIYARGTLKTGHKVQTMERLRPIDSTSHENRYAMGLVQELLSGSVKDAHEHFETNSEESQKLKVYDPVLHNSVRGFVKHLHDNGHTAYFDAHGGNFMERPSTKQLVMTDIFESKEPVNEMMTLNRHPLVNNIKSMNTPEWQDQGEALHDEIGMKINTQSLGRGFRGVAYPHKDHVIKVYRHDPAYHDFVKYAQRNQHDPHMPKIYAHKVIDPNNHVGVVKMERLHSALGDFEHDGLHYTTKYAERVYHENHIPNFMTKEHETFKKDFSTLHASLQKLASDPEVNKFVHKTTMGDFHHKFDIHSANIMKRPSTGHLVLLDPLI